MNSNFQTPAVKANGNAVAVKGTRQEWAAVEAAADAGRISAQEWTAYVNAVTDLRARWASRDAR